MEENVTFIDLGLGLGLTFLYLRLVMIYKFFLKAWLIKLAGDIYINIIVGLIRPDIDTYVCTSTCRYIGFKFC